MLNIDMIPYILFKLLSIPSKFKVYNLFIHIDKVYVIRKYF